jgi:hypothetical protein
MLHQSTTSSKAPAHNVGLQLRGWSARMQACWNLFSSHCPQALQENWSVADYGCGTQELAQLIPKNWVYAGYDQLDRGQATAPLDLSRDWPEHQTPDLGVMLGVLEYLPNNHEVLAKLIAGSRYSLFSCNGSFSPLRVLREGWCWSRPSPRQIRHIIRNCGAQLLAHQPWRQGCGLWLCQHPNPA